MVLCVKQNNTKNNSFVDTLKSATNRIKLYIYIYISVLILVKSEDNNYSP